MSGRIGIFTPSLGLEDAAACLDFVRARGGLVQAWTLPPELAHERKPGLGRQCVLDQVAKGTLRVASLSGYMDWTEPRLNQARIDGFKALVDDCAAQPA